MDFKLCKREYSNIKINKVVTISSTAIGFFYNCNKKIMLGWEWLEKYNQGDIDE